MLEYTDRKQTAIKIVEAWKRAPAEPVIIAQSLGWWESRGLRKLLERLTNGIVQIDKLVMSRRKTLTGVRITSADGAKTVQL